MTKSSGIWLGLALTLLPAFASAQPLQGPLNYGVKNMSFDLWCAETQRYPAERCAARSPADELAFENYRAAIERYELEHLKQVQREYEIRERTNRDPTSTVSRKTDGFSRSPF